MQYFEFSPQEKATIDQYNQSASSWVNSRNTSNFWQDEFELFKSIVPSGKIIELGSGGGRDAKHLLIPQYDYYGTDVSSELLKIASDQNPKARFIESSLYHLPFLNDTFDGFWSAATLLHIPKMKLPSVLMEIKRISKKNAYGFISVKEGNGEQTANDNRFFSYYHQAELTNILQNNRFSIAEKTKKTHQQTTWLSYIIQVK